MNSLSVQGPPIVTKSLLNHSFLQNASKVFLSEIPASSRCLFLVFLEEHVLGFSL